MTRLLRFLTVTVLLIGLAAPTAMAQKSVNPNEAGFAPAPVAEESNEGDPLYGYLAFGFLAGITLFALCRSSRRS